MKCPYREFQDCIVQECPACNYEEVRNETIHGRYPSWMNLETAIKQNMAWREIKKTYRFISCKLIDNSVQPIPATKQTINNTTNTAVVVSKKAYF